MNNLILQVAVSVCSIGCVHNSIAGESFTGTWRIDLRTSPEKQRSADCGSAEFALTQTGDFITGTHSMATVGCGRINEAGPVKGIAVGSTAVLVVTSARNGAIAMGTAKLSKGALRWHQVDEITAGSPKGDSPLILGDGSLTRASQ